MAIPLTEFGLDPASTSATTATLNPNATLPVGTLVVVGLCCTTASAPTIDLTDTGSNTWTKSAARLANGSQDTVMWSSVLTTALTTASVLTITSSIAMTRHCVAVKAFTNVVTGPTTHGTYVETSTSALSAGSVTPSFPSIVFGIVGFNNSARTLSPGAGWNAGQQHLSTTGTNDRGVQLAWLDSAASTSYTTVGTLSTGAPALTGLGYVTLVPSAAVASDTFTRAIAVGLGGAEVGGAYGAVGNPANISVANNKANYNCPAGNTFGNYLPATSALDVNLAADFTINTDITGTTGLFFAIEARRSGTSGGNVYRYLARFNIRPPGTGQSRLQTYATAAGVDTGIGPSQPLTGFDHSTAGSLGTVIHLRMVLTGSNPTRFQFKWWQDGNVEPSLWLLDFTDSTGPQVAGNVGFYGQNGSNNGATIISVDNVKAIVASPWKTAVAKIWDGTSWVVRPTKVWNGSAWVPKPLKVFTG